MSEDPGNALLESLRAHNPWWDERTDAFSLPARQKSDFYHLVRPAELGLVRLPYWLYLLLG